jgi:hypothetical protein
MSKENLKAICSAGVSEKSAGEIGLTNVEAAFPEPALAPDERQALQQARRLLLRKLARC